MRLSIVSIVSVLFAWSAIRGVWLAFDSADYMPQFHNVNMLVWYLCLPFGILVILVSQHSKISKKDFTAIIIPFTFFLMRMLNSYKDESIMLGITATILISMYMCFNDEYKVKIFDLVYWIVQILNVIALFTWVCYVFNINIGFDRVPYYFLGAWERGVYYIKWGIFAIYNNNNMFNRLCSIFNEPGGLGTLLAFLFVIRFSKSKLWEKVLLITTGIFTFSLAFYLMIFTYAALYLIKKDKKYIVLIIAMGIFFINIPNIDWGNPMFNALARRMQIMDSGSIAGDNRTNKSFDQVYERLADDGKALFGYGHGYSVGSSSSYKSLILEFGYIGFLLMLSQWLYFSLKYNHENKDGYILIFMFILSLYQRPRTMQSIYGYVILFGGIAWLQSNAVNEEGT